MSEPPPKCLKHCSDLDLGLPIRGQRLIDRCYEKVDRHQDRGDEYADQYKRKPENEATVWPGFVPNPLLPPALGADLEGRTVVEPIVVSGSVSNWVEVCYPLMVAGGAPDLTSHVLPRARGAAS